MKNTTSFIFILLLVFPFSILAQGIMSFKEETHDFENIEEGTIASFEFEFTNTGNQPIEISEVKASCGCTAPSWTKGPIFPGKTGIIKAAYDSNGRPGPFLKSLTVQSNAKKSVLVLYIKGFVKTKQSTLNQERAKYKVANQPEKYPSVQLDKYAYDFGRIERGERAKHRFLIYNTGQANLVITSLESKCQCVSFGLSTGAVRPNETAILELVLDTDKVQNVEDEFTIHTNDPNNPTKVIKITAEVFENFSKQMFKDKKKTNPFE